jgi:hypothetical protein
MERTQNHFAPRDKEADRKWADYTRYRNVERLPMSMVCKEYARANRFAISWITASTRYGFRDLSKVGDDQVVIKTWPDGVTSYGALYRAMLKYVAEQRVKA